MICSFMDKDLRVTYFAFSEEYGGKHAGFTHSYNIVNALSKFVNISSFFYSQKNICIGGVFYSVVFPSLKNLFCANPFLYFTSYFKVRGAVKSAAIIHERFHVNPIDLLFVDKKIYILEINDPAMILHNNFFYGFLIGLKLRKCSCVITQTNTLKNILSKFTSKPIYVVPNGVDTKKFRPNIKSDVRDRYGIGNNEIVIVFVGAFMPWHGVDEVVRLARQMPHVKFLMVGRGPEYPEVKRKSKELRNIILVGPVNNEEIPKFLSVADILIAPFNTKKFTKMEDYGFWWCPVKIFEYMASGRPIVSYDYQEVSNIIDGCGLLARPGDFNDLFAKTKRLVESKKLRVNLGIMARRRSLSYDWEYRAMEVFKIYKKCLKE